MNKIQGFWRQSLLLAALFLCAMTSVFAAAPAMPSSASPGTTSGPGPVQPSANVNLNWSAMPGATYYVVNVRDLSTNLLVVSDWSVYATSVTLGLLTGHPYRWNVAACNASGCSAAITALYFQTPALPSIPDMPTGASPGMTSGPGPVQSSANVNLGWSAVSGATYYVINVRDLSTDNLVVSNTSVSSTSTTVNLVEGRPYRWNVAACNLSGCSAAITALYFQTAAPIAIPGTPTSASPGVTTGPGPVQASANVNLSWSAMSGATYYVINVRDISTDNLVVSNASVSSTNTTVNLVAGRPYRWNVAACNTAGCSAAITALYFQTVAPIAIPGTPTSASPGVTTGPGPVQASANVNLSWSAMSGATYYVINVRDLFMESLVISNASVLATSTTANLVAGRPYRWNVAACNSSGCSAAITALYFQTAGSDSKYTLSVTKNGNGTVSGGGINCGSICSASYGSSSGSTVTLTATASAGSVFAGWGGACSGTSATCVVAMNTNQSVAAAFNPVLPAVPTGGNPGLASGPGIVQASSIVNITWAATAGATSYGVNVREVATNTLVISTTVTSTNLVATLQTGKQYMWSVAACNAVGCSSRTAALYFQTPGSTVALTIANSGGGSVSSTNVSGITCGTTCSYSYAVGTTVTLAATPAAGYAFTGWGAPCSGTGSCSVSMSVARTVSATFKLMTAPGAATPGTTSASGPMQDGSTVNLGWGTVAGATFYSLTVQDTSVATPVVNKVSVAGTSYSAALTAGKQYRWTVAACNASGCSGTSTPLYFQTPNPSFSLTISKTGSGSVVASSGTGINCGATCTASYPSGTNVVLTATPSAGYYFAGWGAPCSGTGTCTVSMTAARTISAPFLLMPTPSGGSPGSTTSPGPTQTSVTVNLAWGAVTGATYYSLSLQDLTAGTVSNVSVSSAVRPETLQNNKKYAWSVAACNAAGCGGRSTTLYFQTPGPADDHGNSMQTATVVKLGSTTAGKIEVAGDNDYFRIDLTTAGSLDVSTTGSTDTIGNLLDGAGQILAANENIYIGSVSSNFNFRVIRVVPAGTYYIKVRHQSASGTGSYGLVTAFTPMSVIPTKVVLLLHGMNSAPDTWNSLVASRWSGNCPIIYDGIILTDATASAKEVCFNIKFGAQDYVSGIKGLEGVVCNFKGTGCSGDYTRINNGEVGNNLGVEVVQALAAIRARLGNTIQVVLVGHSRGGLAARSALQAAVPSPELSSVIGLVTTGTPHEGSLLGKIHKYLTDNCFKSGGGRVVTGDCLDDWQAVDAIKNLTGNLDIRIPTVGMLSPNSNDIKGIIAGSSMYLARKVQTKKIVYGGLVLGALGEEVKLRYYAWGNWKLNPKDQFSDRSKRYVLCDNLDKCNKNEGDSEFLGDGIVSVKSQSASSIMGDLIFNGGGSVYHTAEPGSTAHLNSALNGMWK